MVKKFDMRIAMNNSNDHAKFKILITMYVVAHQLQL